MKVFLDTSVLVAAVLEQHPDFQSASVVLARVHDGDDVGFVSAHALAEVYATLTKLPPPFRHSPEQALLSVEENVLKYFEVVCLSGADYSSAMREAAAMRIQGGTIYDALHLRCAIKARVERIFTFNLSHFEAVAGAAERKLLKSP